MTKRGCAVLATSKTTRIQDELAFVVHRYDWSESSLILETFTRHHGRVTLVAKGAKRPSSNFRPVLLPLQPLRITYSGDAEIRTLKGAEWVGGHIMPMGEALLSGYYLNELLLRLLARDDPHPRLFDLYTQVVQVLASGHQSGHEGTIAPVLRAFELLLLKDIGLLPDLNLQTLTFSPLQADVAYSLVAEGGLREQSAQERAGLSGSVWQQLFDSLNHEAPMAATLRVCAELPSEQRNALQAQLRALLHYHCGVSTLRTRQVMMDLQAL
jgi:DNA repair protein RecO (recombination protein O)